MNGFVLDGRQVVPTFGVVVADGQFVLCDFAVVVGVDFVEASVAGVFTSAGLVGDLGAGLGDDVEDALRFWDVRGFRSGAGKESGGEDSGGDEGRKGAGHGGLVCIE